MFYLKEILETDVVLILRSLLIEVSLCIQTNNVECRQLFELFRVVVITELKHMVHV